MAPHYALGRAIDKEGWINVASMLRISDAKRDLANTDGLQVHKSWWVSAAAVEVIRNENRKRVIRTHDGTEIPVGRSFEGDLKAAGWT